MLKVVLLGYGELAQSIFIGIVESRHTLNGIFRWETVKKNPFKQAIKDIFNTDSLLAMAKNYEVYEIKAPKANSEEFKKEILKINPDIIIVASWGEILNKDIFILPKIACINCHPSFLPKHRGSNPYTSVLRQGEKTTGVTFHLMSEGIDSGEILLQKEVEITEDDNGETLRRKIAFKAKELVPELLDKLASAELVPQKQDEAKATYYPRTIEEDAKINWDKPALEIHNQIRALYPWIKCYTLHNDQFLYIKATKIVNLGTPVNTPGKILNKSHNSLIVSTADPYKAIMAEKIEAYGFLSNVWTKNYINHKIKIGDVFKEV